MFARALLAFLILPGVFAGLVPCFLVTIDPWRGNGNFSGAIITAFGLFILFWCIRDFYVSGKGTLAPWAPPSNLVTVGLYRFTRNPMYLGVLIIIVGLSLFAGSPLLILYLLAIAFGFHLRVVLYEEPKLLKLFGNEWKLYSSRVSRWLPFLKP